MRRVSYQFPRRCDLEFEAPVPFPQFMTVIEKFSARQDNFRDERGPIKREFVLSAAQDRLGFERIVRGAGQLANVTEEADFQLQITDTILRSSVGIPLSEHRFLVRALDKGNRTELFVTKVPSTPGLSAFEVKQMILGMCA